MVWVWDECLHFGAGTHKLYCGTTVYGSISNSTTTFNTAVTCGSNALTCGALTCTTGTLGGNTIATTNLIPSLTGYVTSASLTGTLSNYATLNLLGTYATLANLGSYATLANLTGYAPLASPTFTGAVTIADSSYGNTKLSITNVAGGAAYTYYPSYIYIGQAVGGYGAAIGGGIRQNEGGVLTIHSVNGGAYTETFRTCWDLTMINTKLTLGSNMIECGPIS